MTFDCTWSAINNRKELKQLSSCKNLQKVGSLPRACHLQVGGQLSDLVRGSGGRDGISVNDAAKSLGIALALAKEQLLAAESKGTTDCKSDNQLYPIYVESHMLWYVVMSPRFCCCILMLLGCYDAPFGMRYSCARACERATPSRREQRCPAFQLYLFDLSIIFHGQSCQTLFLFIF